MKCPACFNELLEIRVAGLAVDVCAGGCGGIWFDAFELKQVEELPASAANELISIQRDPIVQVDLHRKRSCPRCLDIKLMRHFFSPRRKVQVEQCPNCAGFWLDAGELSVIVAEMRENRAEAQLSETESPALTTEMIRRLYRMRLSELAEGPAAGD